MSLLLLLAVFIFVYHLIPAKPLNKNPVWGATFSHKYAKSLNLDWKKTFISILDDLNFREIRLAAYWDEIEPVNNEYDFENLDWMINEVKKRNGNIILAVGRKNVRWPECFEPEWTQDIDYDKKEQELLEMVETVIKRYKDVDEIKIWQVENEVFFPFGSCPEPNEHVFKKELELVRSLDDRPIMLTDSGELSSWLEMIEYADILGITIYRDVSNPLTGDFHWPNPPGWYSKRAWLAEQKVKQVIVAEFQMEPWFNAPFISIPVADQNEKFDLEKFKNNIIFAKKAGFEKYYIWGVEWWYYMKKHNYSQYFKAAKSLN